MNIPVRSDYAEHIASHSYVLNKVPVTPIPQRHYAIRQGQQKRFNGCFYGS